MFRGRGNNRVRHARRMHGLMIGQPNFGSTAPAAKAKAVRGKGGRFVKADEQAPAPPAPAGDYEQQLEDVKSKMLADYDGDGSGL